ncbi:MAG: putative sulfate exporter family transporter [Chloroflexi bacterium]|nr:MAG: putative sulfate exporter family transporter [Chloroflexota bacterium]
MSSTGQAQQASSSTPAQPAKPTIVQAIPKLVPGLLWSLAVALAAMVIAHDGGWLNRNLHIEPVLVALVLGIVIRTAHTPHQRANPGLAFAGKRLLEVAIVLVGLTLQVRLLLDLGPTLLVGIPLAVALAIAAGMYLGKRLGINATTAVLIAVGSAICGNSAIMAVAPSVRAKAQEVVTAITVTAILSIGVVLVLPSFGRAVGLSDNDYGIVAGMTVYAVPQVLAATLPFSAQSAQAGTVVKLLRVLLLGPTVAFFAVYTNRREAGERQELQFSLAKYVPWFIIGFALTIAFRAIAGVSDSVNDAARESSRFLTIMAMAALGLAVDMRALRQVSLRLAMLVAALVLLLFFAGLAIALAPSFGG